MTTLTHPVPRAAGCPLDPPPGYVGALAEGPLRRLELWDGRTPWLVTRHAEVRAVLGDRSFSADVQRPEFPFVAPPSDSVRAGQSFLRMDDPDHQRLRRMLAAQFRVGTTEALRPQVQEMVDGLLDRLEQLPQPVDLVAELALPLPSLVICLLLGVPYAERAAFQADSALILDTGAPLADRAGAGLRVREYLGELAQRRAAEPADDVLSQLCAREAAGELTRAEVVGSATLLLVAGHETTANQTALSVLTLLQHPEQLAALRADPELVPGAVEELLRHLSVVQTFVGRVATQDVQVGETLVRAGDSLYCILSAANRDPAQFEDPDTLDLHRDARRHVAFGFGVHQCLGQTLARVELQVVLGTLLRRLPDLALAADADTLEFRTESVVYGVRSLPVTF